MKAAGLVDTLSGKGPFTVFAPTNRAFDKLPDGTVPTLLKPENKGKLTSILTYHVVPGTLTAQDLWDMVDKMDGKAELKTVNGESLWIKRVSDKHLAVYDPEGHAARITICRRDAVERRHPRHRHRRAAELTHSMTGAGQTRRPSPCAQPRDRRHYKRGSVLPGGT